MTAPVAPFVTTAPRPALGPAFHNTCGMCMEPPSRSGPILPLGPDGENVDMGHEDCFRLAEQAVRAACRAAQEPGRVRA